MRSREKCRAVKFFDLIQAALAGITYLAFLKMPQLIDITAASTGEGSKKLFPNALKLQNVARCGT